MPPQRAQERAEPEIRRSERLLRVSCRREGGWPLAGTRTGPSATRRRSLRPDGEGSLRQHLGICDFQPGGGRSVSASIHLYVGRRDTWGRPCRSSGCSHIWGSCSAAAARRPRCGPHTNWAARPATPRADTGFIRSPPMSIAGVGSCCRLMRPPNIRIRAFSGQPPAQPSGDGTLRRRASSIFPGHARYRLSWSMRPLMRSTENFGTQVCLCRWTSMLRPLGTEGRILMCTRSSACGNSDRGVLPSTKPVAGTRFFRADRGRAVARHVADALTRVALRHGLDLQFDCRANRERGLPDPEQRLPRGHFRPRGRARDRT